MRGSEWKGDRYGRGVGLMGKGTVGMERGRSGGDVGMDGMDEDGNEGDVGMGRDEVV